MKKEVKDKLDKEIFKRKIKFYAVFAVPLLIMAIIFTVFFPVSSNNIKATAIRYSIVQSDDGITPVMWARLDNNSIVRVSMPVNIVIKQGEAAEIIKTNTLIGAPTYRFLRYVN